MSDAKPTVGLVMKSLAAEFFQNMRSVAEKYANARGDLNLISVGTQTQTEVDIQIDLVEELIEKKVDAILVIPIDSKALIPPVVRAIHAGIKVINFDVILDQDELSQNKVDLAFYGPDNNEAAKTVGHELGKKLWPGAKVIILEGISEASNAQQRLNGFMQVVEEYGFSVLASQSANWETDEAYKVFSKLIKKHPDVQGVMCANDAMALGVIRALKEIDSDGKIQVVGIDNDASAKKLIEQGSMLATIDLQTEKMVAQAIDAAMDALKGKHASGWIKTPTRLITKGES